MSASSFDPVHAPLDGTAVIEANAGTGKTYTITALYLRLLLEQNLDVESILVVTFTEAATAELRDRIRKRLTETAEAFSEGAPPAQDAVTRELLERFRDHQWVRLKLTAALTGFDQAPIYTIHGFCKRALSDSAFESAMAFRTEIIPDPAPLLQEIVEDFWRREAEGASRLFTRYLASIGITPDTLRSEIERHVGKPYLTVRPSAEALETRALEEAMVSACRTARELWLAEQEAIARLLHGAQGLHKGTYKPEKIAGWLSEIGVCLSVDTPPMTLCDGFGRLSTPALTKGTNKSGVTPQHAFFDACQALHTTHEALIAAYRCNVVAMRVRLLEFADAELATRKAARGLQSYDDLLLNLRAALEGERGPALAESLRKRYQAALIDEFQDTDPVQYELFRRIYDGDSQPVFLVGDPKQSIYSFRGADVFTYLRARKDAARTHTLDRNWRSSKALLEAVNRLFTAASDPFLIEEISFAQSSSAPGDRGRLEIDGDTGAPLTIWYVEAGDDGKAIGKTAARERASAATATEIARLLSLGKEGRARIVEPSGRVREVCGGDVAVLVRSHFEATAVRDALAARGVSAVQRGSRSVFETSEAEELERVLRAIAEPSRSSLVTGALATELIGRSGSDLFNLQRDELAWEREVECFREAHRQWHERGFMPMLRWFFERYHVLRQVLSHADGERRATNLLQLAELLHCDAERQGISGLLGWFAAKRKTPQHGNEGELLRLESDENLVKILTMHVSKGLEFPVVFCPFVWDGDIKSANKRNKVLRFHDPEANGAPTVDFGSDESDVARGHAVREERAENLRLLYVALTRARFRLWTVWGHIKDAQTSALAWLLHRNAAGAVDLTDMRADLERLAAGSAGGMTVVELPAGESVHVAGVDENRKPLAARAFTGTLRDTRRLTSFTALAHGRAVEAPDYDARDRAEEGETEMRAAPAEDIFAFPRGAQAGTCLHAIFEHVDFAACERGGLERLIRSELKAHGLDSKWTDTVADMVEAVIDTPLDDSGMRLSAVTRRQRVDELEFYYPLAPLTDRRLRKVLEGGGFPDAIRSRIDGLEFLPTQGYMHGFIDLVFEHGGRYYLADYKSNWLGGSVADYGQEELAEAMGREAYYLQYLVYCVALHRYLRTRIPGYSYDTHFGGVRYLFLRGMRPAAGAAYGVFAHRPDAAFIARLDAFFSA